MIHRDSPTAQAFDAIDGLFMVWRHQPSDGWYLVLLRDDGAIPLARRIPNMTAAEAPALRVDLGDEDDHGTAAWVMGHRGEFEVTPIRLDEDGVADL